MVNFFQKNLRNLRKKSSQQGQAAFILVLIIAIALIFYAVTLNLGKVSETKTIVTVASNTGASLLMSQMASYGQSLFQTTLGGENPYCDNSGFFSALVTLFVAIIITAITVGAGAVLVIAIISIVIAAAAAVLQLTVIEPGLTKNWNKQIAELLSMPDQFIENALSSALTAAVTDQVLLPDVYDVDSDGKFGFEKKPDGTYDMDKPRDKTSRYGYFYSQRLNGLPRPTNDITITDITNFQTALNEFLTNTGDNWGVYDAGNCPSNSASFSSGVCTVACAGPEAETGSGINCSTLTPYQHASMLLPYAYEPFYENMANNSGGYTSFISFREYLGRDDENKYYSKYSSTPNGPQQYQTSTSFRIQDVTGYNTADPQKGVFSFFYKAADWGLDLATTSVYTNPTACYLCDSRYGVCSVCAGAALPPELNNIKLVLPVVPSTLIYDPNPFVNGTNNNVSSSPPIASDKVTFPLNILASDSQCADLDPTTGQLRSTGFWKRGTDRYCSVVWPYAMACPKHGSTCTIATMENCAQECDASGTNKSEWRDDALDTLIYGMTSFISWAKQTLDQSPEEIMGNFVIWYDDEDSGAWRWIEKTTGVASASCYICNSYGVRSDALWMGSQNFTAIKDRINNFRTSSYIATPNGNGTGYDDVWCVPSSGNSLVYPDETTAIGSGTNLQKVMNCLNHNINKQELTYNNSSYIGNAGRFKACIDRCDDVIADPYTGQKRELADHACGEESASGQPRQYLPRSLVPGFDPTGDYFLFGDYTDYSPTEALPEPSGYSCYDNTVGGYREKLNQSYMEAQNQVEKFKVRYAFLSSLNIQATDIVNKLQEGINKINGFLGDSRVTNIINKRSNYTGLGGIVPNPQVSNAIIYAWRDEGSTLADRLVHIVRADARIPTKCAPTGSSGTCGVPNASGNFTADPQWPQVKTYTKNLSMTRCYKLDYTDGVVKMRVVRYDEPRAATSLLFPNGIPIWQFRQSREGGASPANDLAIVKQQCFLTFNPAPLISQEPYQHLYQNAFLMNKASDNVSCWQAANRLLEQGVSSETCGKYYYHSVTSSGVVTSGLDGMGFNFIPCPAGTIGQPTPN